MNLMNAYLVENVKSTYSTSRNLANQNTESLSVEDNTGDGGGTSADAQYRPKLKIKYHLSYSHNNGNKRKGFKSYRHFNIVVVNNHKHHRFPWASVPF
jgi:hypothetical protein